MELGHRHGQLLVGKEYIANLLGRRHWHHGLLQRVGALGQCASHGLHLGFHGLSIEIPHDHQSLIFGPIPLMVEFPDGLVREALQEIVLPYQAMRAILRALEKIGQHGLRHPPLGIAPRALLLHYHSTLTIDLIVLHGYIARPIAQHQKARIQYSLPSGGHI